MAVRLGLGYRPTRRDYELATRETSPPPRDYTGLKPGLTDLELGWLIGVIETDGAIYPETRGRPGQQDRPRRVALEVENADEAMMERVASYFSALRLGGSSSIQTPRATGTNRRSEFASAASAPPTSTASCFRISCPRLSSVLRIHSLVPRFCSDPTGGAQVPPWPPARPGIASASRCAYTSVLPG